MAAPKKPRAPTFCDLTPGGAYVVEAAKDDGLFHQVNFDPTHSDFGRPGGKGLIPMFAGKGVAGKVTGVRETGFSTVELYTCLQPFFFMNSDLSS